MTIEVVYPKQVILEVTSNCNLRCKGCALHGPQQFTKRHHGFMKEAIWRKAITEIGSWSVEVNLTTHGGGEPLLHPSLKELLLFASGFSNIKTGFLSNAMLLDRNWTDFLLTTGLDWIAFSVDGTDPETHKVVRKGSDLKVIERNINYFIEAASKTASSPQILLNMVQYEEVASQSEEFVKKWLPYVNTVMLSHYRNPPSSKRWPGVPEQKEPCSLLWSQMVIAWDGRMGLCCEDFDIECCLGQIDEHNLLSIWNGEKINEIRQMHKDGRQKEIYLCKACDTWADVHVDTVEDRQRGYSITKKASGLEYKKI